MRAIISGGGTGGHIFPAISIANEIKARHPEAEILFVGAEDRMEMERVPAAGYKIIGLPVAGFDRKHLLKNIAVLVKLGRSLSKARKIVKEFRPDIAIGVGGYASGPLLKAASKMGVPTLLQEQNSYAGVTNKLLAQKANTICVAYEGMEAFFPAKKIVLTGNPVRQDLLITEAKKKEAYTHFNLDPNKKTILIIGGSLGAKTINESILAYYGSPQGEHRRLAPQGERSGLDPQGERERHCGLDPQSPDNVQIIWQTGKAYYEGIAGQARNDKSVTATPHPSPFTLHPTPFTLHPTPYTLHPLDFISRMDLAYSIADLIISRAGAGSISEFCLLGKPVILVPSPNVAEDHQTKNAQALVKRGAAMMIADKDAVQTLIPTALKLMQDAGQLKTLSDNILKLAKPNAAKHIADEIDILVQKKLQKK
ncbi:UDP-N-acetylglucosamine--N-acetylmuramyl-(pentapeptide) pyrophosphoryl-undecaprenol N-acetylglucosamine transferase [Bacteroidia bacterium]|nr:UDP-N-acetylglucosamine--N-acetylmuramyl-(pentapeptide) pyrophosphoryl-undecaprenol N-acetylglucosamine transferase [Bacteroidia bacterium]